MFVSELLSPSLTFVQSNLTGKPGDVCKEIETAHSCYCRDEFKKLQFVYADEQRTTLKLPNCALN